MSFSSDYYQRIIEWMQLRNSLEWSKTPFDTLTDFYQAIPKITLNADPYDSTTWPGPWELIEENQYCDFTKVLGMCYSLQLTNRFKNSKIRMYTGTDSYEEDILYWLSVDGHPVSLCGYSLIPREELDFTKK